MLNFQVTKYKIENLTLEDWEYKEGGECNECLFYIELATIKMSVFNHYGANAARMPLILIL